MMDNSNKINVYQLWLILIHAQIGVGMITFVNDVYMKARTDSWLSVLLAGIIIQTIIFLYGLLMKRFSKKNLFEIMEVIFGGMIGKLFILIYSLYLIVVCSILLAKYTVILKSWMMPLTPKWILVAAISTIGIYLAKENLHIISRFFILATLVILVFLGFVIYALKDANFTYILPIGNAGVIRILKGVVTTSYSFQGFEYILFLAPFTLASTKQIVKTSTIANVFITFFYTFIVLANQLFFSPKELKLITEPIFYLVKSFSFNIIERPDLLFTSLWIVLVVTSIVVLLYVASLGLRRIFNGEKRIPFVHIAAIISFILSIIFYGENRIHYVAKVFNPIIIIFSVGVPLFLLLLSLLFNKTGEKKK